MRVRRFFLFLSVFAVVAANAAEDYTVYALNAGFDRARYGRFAPDDHRDVGLPAAYRDPSFTKVYGLEKIVPAVPEAVFLSGRWHNQGLNYRLPHLDPKKTYDVRLYSLEAYYETPTTRVMSVSINGVLKEARLDPFASGGGKDHASAHVYSGISPRADGVLAIDLKPVVDYPHVVGLEVVEKNGGVPVQPVLHCAALERTGVRLGIGSTTGDVVYDVRRRQVQGGAWETCASGVAANVWCDATGTAGLEYAVRAVDPVRHTASPWSNAIAVTPGIGPIVVVSHARLRPSHVYTYHVEGLSPGGGLYVYDPVSGDARELVNADKGVILDAQVSYDGTQILFSWKRTMKEPFSIWRINADGTGLVQVVGGCSNNQNACWLPDGGVAFTSDRKPAFAYCWTSTSPVLYRADGDGKNVTRLSANYLTDFTPSVMNDGRILFSRWEYVDRPAIPIQSLWAIQPDGTGLSGVFGNRVLSPATFMFAHDVPGRPGQFLCVMTSHGCFYRGSIACAGALGLIDITKGGNAQAAIRNLTPEIFVAPVGSGIRGEQIYGPYTTPYPLDRDRYLVSRAGEIQLRAFDSPAVVTVLAGRSCGLGWYSPMPLAPRPLPAVKRASTLDPKIAPLAEVVVQDVRIGLEKYVAPGEVKRLVVVQEMEKDIRAENYLRQFGVQFPVVSCGATYASKRVLGFAEVERDGSAHFLVPSGKPIYFLPLDAEGRAVQRMRTFTHFMPGEKQSCIGCHADRNYVSISPTQIGKSLAAQRPAAPLVPPSWGAKDGFSFVRVVQPVLDRHCVRCHSGEPEAPEPELTGDRTDYFNVAYENLARKGTAAEDDRDHQPPDMARFGRNPYTSWIPTYNNLEENILWIRPKFWGSHASRLSWIVAAGHPDVTGKKRVNLTDDERLRIHLWIDLNVPFYGTSQSRQPKLRGCRKVFPASLAAVCRDIEKKKGVPLPYQFYVRYDRPERNAWFVRGVERGIFSGPEDPDYKRLMDEILKARPQLDLRNHVDFRDVRSGSDR
ncbi:MAG: hypothetical protein MJ249_07720 [Kiritimatiellae bacterium]|nr:hypothetical protein [Kiritimatiellia bacterium]